MRKMKVSHCSPVYDVGHVNENSFYLVCVLENRDAPMPIFGLELTSIE